MAYPARREPPLEAVVSIQFTQTDTFLNTLNHNELALHPSSPSEGVHLFPLPRLERSGCII
jgi:hypothetical protein